MRSFTLLSEHLIVNHDFGAALTAFMEGNHLTKREISERTGIAQPMVGRLLKTSQFEMSTLRKITAGLQVEISVTPDGGVIINPLDIPADVEITAHTSTLIPGRVYFKMYDKKQKIEVFKAELLYQPGESEPSEVTITRLAGVPGYVSEYGLLRWAKTYAERLLQSGSEKMLHATGQ